MYIYNISFNIEANELTNFKIWLQGVFINQINHLNFHQSIKIIEVISKHQSGTTVSIQLGIKDMNAFGKFEINELNTLKEELFKIFNDKVLCFDTMLKDISNEYDLN